MSKGSAFFTRDDGTVAVFQSADDCLDYGLDHAALLVDGDEIAASTWAAEGGIVIESEGVVGAVAVAMVAGTGGHLTNFITTRQGRRRVTTLCVEPAASCG